MIDRFTAWLNRPKTVLLLILLAFVLRASFGIAIGHRFLPMADQIAFDELARNLANGKGLMITERLILPPKNDPLGIGQIYFTKPERVRDLRMNALWGVIQPNTPTAFFEPLVPLIFGAIYKVFSPGLIAPRILQSLLDALVVGMIFSIGRMALPRSRVPGFAALIYVFYPISIMFTGALITQPIYLFLQCATVYLFYRFAIKGGWQNALLFGLAFGLTSLSRISIISFAPAFIIALAFQDGRKVKWLPVVSAILLAGLLLLPWVLRNERALGKPLLFPTKGGRNLWEYNNQVFSLEQMRNKEAEGVDIIYRQFALKYFDRVQGKNLIEFPEFTHETELERDQILTQRVKQFIKRNPGIYFRLCTLRLYQFFRITPSHHQHLFFKMASICSFGLVLPLSLLGMVLLLKWWRRIGLIYLLILYNVVVHSLTASGIPHRMPLDPFFILFAAFTLNWILIKAKIIGDDKTKV